MRVLVALVATAFLTVGVSAFDYVMTFENPSNKEIDLYYIGKNDHYDRPLAHPAIRPHPL